MVDEGKALLTPLAAAHHFGITTELLFQFTKRSFGKTSGLRTLRTVEHDGKTRFTAQDLNDFDALLAGQWCDATENRPRIPKAILDHLRAESQNQCARCGSGIGVDTAHIIPWTVSRSHHPHNLIRICSACHREHDGQQSLSTEQLRAIKEGLIARMRASLMDRMQPSPQRLRTPRASRHFFGRGSELISLVDALQSGRSVTISGSGGIGKSELLLQALSRCETGRAVLWCNIEQYRTVTDLISALRTELAMEGVACSEEALPSRLDAAHACVVFDGIEQSSLDDLDEFEDLVTTLFHATSDTQFVSTSQIKRYGFPAETSITLRGLDEPASRSLLYQSCAGSNANIHGDTDALLKFCDGHALTIRLAGALVEHYGSAASAMTAINKRGTQSVSLPSRKRHSRQTSLELCLQTAYAALLESSRKLLWALAQAPAGLFTNYIESNFLKLDDVIEALASLRQWHLIDVIPVDDHLSRIRLLTPIRHFVANRGRNEELASYEHIVSCTVRGIGMMVAVLELKYDTPEDTPYVIQRYSDELPNLLHILELARAREEDHEVVTFALSVARSLIRYFFVKRLPEQGARIMQDAAELALRATLPEKATDLAMLFMSLAHRADDDALITTGLNLVDRIESMVKTPGRLPDLSMCRAFAAHWMKDFPTAEQHARQAFEGYRAQVRIQKEVDNVNDRDDVHNNISNALGMLGFSLLSQQKYEEAAKAYRHSLQHDRGASIAVNRGQTLHQIGNCESYLGNHKAAAELYVEAAKIFHFVRMEEYLSNAFGELGYSLLEVDLPELIDQLNEELVDSALVDLGKDAKRVFNSSHPLNHQLCIGMIRKLFGTMILLSLTGYGRKPRDFCAELVKATVVVLVKQVDTGLRDKDELFAIMMVDLALHIGALIAQGEIELEEKGDIGHETVGDLLRLVCEAHDWAQDVMRVIDWFSVYISRRWRFRGINSSRLREFVSNYNNDIEDYLDLER